MPFYVSIHTKHGNFGICSNFFTTNLHRSGFDRFFWIYECWHTFGIRPFRNSPNENSNDVDMLVWVLKNHQNSNKTNMRTMQSSELQSAFFASSCVWCVSFGNFCWSNHSWCQCVRESANVTYTIKPYTWNEALLIDITIILCDENCLPEHIKWYYIPYRYPISLSLEVKKTNFHFWVEK